MKKILIVDDEDYIRDLVKKTLGRPDRTVITAKNGQEAVKLAIAEIPNLIMMDVKMPGEIDGLEAVRTIKQDDRTKLCKVIMLTAMGEATDREKGRKAGADEYFVKPFSPLELMKKVDEMLE